MEDSLGWLPEGWIMEIKTRKGGMSAGTQYKCYIAPRTGCKFYSKQEVFRYLKSGKIDGKAPQTKRRTLNVLSADNVVSRIEKSPDGLPQGWTKEIKFRKKRGDGYRRDPYYTESATGYIFRSLRDVIRYLETGDVGIHVSKPKKMCTSAKDSTDNKLSSPVTAKRQKLAGNSAKRRLFESQGSNVKGATAEQISGSTIEEQCAEDVDSRSLGCTKKHPKTRKRKMVQVKKPSFTMEDELAESGDKKLLVNGVILESEDKNKELKTNKQLTQNTTLSESGASNHTGNEVLFGPLYGKPSDNCMSMESDDTKQQMENQTLETHKHLVQNMGLSELEDEKRENGALLESRNEKLSGEVLPESGDNNPAENEALPELQGRKQSEAIVSEETKPLENGALPELQGSKQSEAIVSEETKPLENGELPELQGRKQPEVIVSENTKPLENGAPFESEAKTTLEENCKSGTTRLRSRKTKAEKATLLPRRASKRLAGFEAEGVALDVTPPKRSHRLATMHLEADHALESTPSSLAEQVSEQLDQLIFNLQVDPTHDVGSTLSFCAEQVSKPNDESKFSPQPDCLPCTPQGNGGTERQPEKHADCTPLGNGGTEGQPEKHADCTPLGNGGTVGQPEKHADYTPLGNKRTEGQPEKPLVEEPQLEEKLEYPPILPFGDSWLDPCIEFAFKTLTGDIPEAMDTTAIEDYFQQQLEVSPPQNLASDGMLQSELIFQPSKDMVVGPVEGGKPEEKGKHH